MDRIIEKLDHGWWVVSHEQKLWLPKGELPYGEAANFDLVGQRALQIGEWQGEPVWLVQLQRRHDMGSVRQVIDLDVGLIVIDPKELLEANWYRYDDLPLLPPPGTVARRLIEDTVAMCRAEYE